MWIASRSSSSRSSRSPRSRSQPRSNASSPAWPPRSSCASVRTTELSRQSPRPAEEQLPSWVATLHRLRPEGNVGATALEVETAGGATPEVATEGPHRVVFDGWLYNREELRRVSGAAADANAAR